jgi:CubicO group peptidase (beta-lactamase class C family)
MRSILIVFMTCIVAALGSAHADMNAPNSPKSVALPHTAADSGVDVDASNWYWGPANRWSWHNTRRIFPTAQIGRGSGSPAPLMRADRDLSTVSFLDPVTHRSMTVAQMLDATYTDGFLVLRHGQILAETYRNGMTQNQPHLLMSVSKSIIGTLAGILVGQGRLADSKLISDYIPEMRGTVYEGATIRNLLDMSVDDPQARAALNSTRGSLKEYEAVDEAGGWLPATKSSAPGLRAYLTGLRRPHGENGKSFLYLDQSTILMSWVMERATGKDIADLLTQELWTKLGAEQDAYMLLDHHQQAYASAGLNATLRDLGRFGEMMAQNGTYNGQSIVPDTWVKDIRSNGADGPNNARSRGLAAVRPWPGHRRGTYRNFWWVTEGSCGRFAGVGLGGQLLIVDPIADIVVVKFDSVFSPEMDEAVFQTEYQGIDAVIQSISGHGCS